MAGRFWRLFLVLALCQVALAKKDWDVPPAECPSENYHWNGKMFICLEQDRVDGILSQRDHYYQVNLLCQQREVAGGTMREMIRLQDAARAECSKMGKKFDAKTYLCVGSLNKGE